ncbi:MAG: ShlB/FhaC/HecB family hemolysin secretion/activation protein [Cyanobacteria bacterium J06639_14]
MSCPLLPQSLLWLGLLTLHGLTASAALAQTPNLPNDIDLPDDIDLPERQDVLPTDTLPLPDPELPTEDLEEDPLQTPETLPGPIAPQLEEPDPLTTGRVTVTEIIFIDRTVFTEAELLASPLTTLRGCENGQYIPAEAPRLDPATPTNPPPADFPQPSPPANFPQPSPLPHSPTPPLPHSPTPPPSDSPLDASSQPCPPLSSILGESLSAPQIYQVATDIAGFYASQGYRTTGAVIDVSGTPDTAVLEIVLVEDQLEAINLNDSILDEYVEARLGVTEDEPLNVDRLQEKLRLLQLDPLIEGISASLSTGSRTGRSVLDVEVDAAPPFRLPLRLDNASSPSVGSFQQQITLEKTHVLGIGDTLSLGYTHSDGSDDWEINYTAIINPNNDTLNFRYSYSNNIIIEEPFDRLDIRSNSHSYEFSYRHPVYRTIRGIRQEDPPSPANGESTDPEVPRQLPTYEELAVTFGLAVQNSNSTLEGMPFGFSEGSEERGNTRTVVLQAGQEWTQQNALQVLSLRSQFNLGVGLLGATVRPDSEDVPAIVEFPDGRFLSWRGQGQWVRIIDPQEPNLLFVLRGSAQFALDSLLSSQKFSLGGFGTVRGYRKDSLLIDNGILLSAELYFPVFEDRKDGAVLQLIPFIDYGIGWNSAADATLSTSRVRSSFGVSFLWTQGDLRARLDVGVPLIDLDSDGTTWQENGVYFSIQYAPRF